ncbi:hypothetical protein [Brevibacterium aurantiacum]|uniref:SHOCT domain-containing protein n=1 Tax=Brevibacterium aurantiacum TaxID=273384 RepID=A0A556C3J2_BREAU|nr:hypothetical protein [Brevibacterium aurantiacum]TSI11981.1 hypothetical protein FO013_21295 [Brevibacterium aurantiacum]
MGLVIVAIVASAIALVVTLVRRRQAPETAAAAPLEQVERLADLRDRALISPSEFERLKGDVTKA